jgi:hypothetical protein
MQFSDEPPSKRRRLTPAALENSIGAVAALVSLYVTGGRDPLICGVTGTFTALAASFGFRQVLRCNRGMCTAAKVETSSSDVCENQNQISDVSSGNVSGNSAQAGLASAMERLVETCDVRRRDVAAHDICGVQAAAVSPKSSEAAQEQVIHRQRQDRKQEQNQQGRKSQVALHVHDFPKGQGKHPRRSKIVMENAGFSNSVNTAAVERLEIYRGMSSGHAPTHPNTRAPKERCSLKPLVVPDQAEEPDSRTVVDSESDHPDDEAVLEIMSSDDESLQSTHQPGSVDGVEHDGYTQASQCQSQHLKRSDSTAPLLLC